MRAHGSASSSSTPWYGPFISADARVRQKVPNPHPVHCLLRELHGLEAVVGQNVPLVQDLGGRGKPARESQQRWERTDTLARGRGGQGLSAAASSRSLPLLLVPQGGGRPRGRPSRPRQSSAAAPGPLGCLALDAAVGRSTRHTRPSPRRWTLSAGSAPRSATGSCRPCGSGLSAPPACTPYFARVCDFPKTVVCQTRRAPGGRPVAGMLTKGGGRKKKKGSEDARLAEKYACPPSSSAAARVWQLSLEVASAFEAHPFHVYCQCAMSTAPNHIHHACHHVYCHIYCLVCRAGVHVGLEAPVQYRH